ncbi:ketoacyl-ACP synthase III family protein [Streptomyces sp. BHT-5-2]|uniref:ketoacyl-ACP synthase III family protein n=1 Tax=Streptomyces sp. BHT-5-2 TaxID=2866715 RepID=UPI001C8F0107|nr:ketoacyl-ACP synthase III family protein [Streptomyces sp. BHT-5-2]QZL06406.1 ketoacyl-ACP synthase III family protein [Streptomyces sp. BHT-5-2]
MHWKQELYVAAVGTALASPASAESDVAAGRMTAERRAQLDYVSVRVSSDEAAADLAVRAGRAAVRQSGLDPQDIRLVLHSRLWFQGLDMWVAASYVAAGAVGAHPVAFDVQQRSNPRLGTLEMAAACLTAGPSAVTTALLTTGDRFAAPAIDRWNSQEVCAYGEGETALLLSSRARFARLLATVTLADNTLGPAGRGNELFADAPGGKVPVPLLQRAEDYASSPASDGSDDRLLSRSADSALADADTSVDDHACAVLPATHRGNGRYEFHHLLGLPEERTTWDFGRRTGHLGTGDQFGGLAHLLEEGNLAPGGRVLPYAGGAGYTCTAAVIEMTGTVRAPWEWQV